MDCWNLTTNTRSFATERKRGSLLPVVSHGRVRVMRETRKSKDLPIPHTRMVPISGGPEGYAIHRGAELKSECP